MKQIPAWAGNALIVIWIIVCVGLFLTSHLPSPDSTSPPEVKPPYDNILQCYHPCKGVDRTARETQELKAR